DGKLTGELPAAHHEVERLRHAGAELLVTAHGNLPDGRDREPQGAIFPAETVLNVPAGDLGAKVRVVFHQLRPGEGVDHAEALAETMLYLRQQGIESIHAHRVVIAGDGAQNCDGVEQLVQGNGLAGGD